MALFGQGRKLLDAMGCPNVVWGGDFNVRVTCRYV
jgi:hypothetical protein